MTSPRPDTLPSDRLPVRVKIGMAAGYAAANVGPTVFAILLFPIFNIVLGISPVLLSWVLFFQRVWHANADPVVGQVSDNLRTRWGRRRPFILLTAVPLAVSFTAIWCFPSGLTSEGQLAYLLAVSLVFFTLHSCYSIPLAALGIESTRDYRERIRLNTVIQAITFLATICAQWAFPFIQSRSAGDTRIGAREFGLIAGVLIAVCAILPYFLVPERGVLRAAAPLKPSFRQGLAAALENKPFLCLLAARTVFRFSYNVVSVFGLYLNYYAIFGGDIKRAALMQGVNGTVFQVAAIASLVVYRRLALNLGKRYALVMAAAVLAAGSLCKLFVYIPGEPYWQLVVYAANGAADGGVAMLIDAMLPDVADVDELETGVRREGLYAAVLSWCDRIGYSVGALISGYLLVAVGFDAKLGGAQRASAIEWMKWGYFAPPFLGGCLIVWFACRYTLTEDSGYRTKALLELRRGESEPGI